MIFLMCSCTWTAAAERGVATRLKKNQNKKRNHTEKIERKIIIVIII